MQNAFQPKTLSPFTGFKGFTAALYHTLKMVGVLLLLLSLASLGLTDAGQETYNFVNLHDSNPSVLQSLAHKNIPVAVSVSAEDLSMVSSTVLMAETWLRSHVLTHFPATKITTIIVGNTLLCNDQNWSSVLPTVRNLYYSLVRWGLEKEIKVSPCFQADCFIPGSLDGFSENLLEPLMYFLESTDNTYSVNTSDETMNLVPAHESFMKKLGFVHLSSINVIVSKAQKKEEKPITRKPSLVSSEVLDPFPARPTPLSPIRSSIGYSVPAHVSKSPLSPTSQTVPPHRVKSPPVPPSFQAAPPPSFQTALPPSFQTTPPPAGSFSFVPDGSPVVAPANPPDLSDVPPCAASPPATPPPEADAPLKKLWCVAKPSVPAETLQESLDYACGVGGADCEEIQPHGSCYNPDTIVAHASYAFNSFWQKTKNNGGSCSFGGTAILINTDPSFRNCRFILT